MLDDLSQDFWDRADDITAGMLSADGAAPRPMAHQVRSDERAFYFITAKGTDIADAAQNGSAAQHIIACAHGQLYAAINGTLHVETSRDKLNDIWSPIAAVWFDDGREDEDICLVRFTPKDADVWTTDGTAKTLYEFGKAALTDDLPDVGDHAKLHF